MFCFSDVVQLDGYGVFCNRLFCKVKMTDVFCLFELKFYFPSRKKNDDATELASGQRSLRDDTMTSYIISAKCLSEMMS